MQVAKILVILLLFVGLAGAGFYYSASRIPVENIDVSKLSSQLPKDMPQLSGNVTQQLSTLGERAQVVGGHVQNVLGSAIEINEEATKSAAERPLHEKALDYAQYQYCKQVVTQFEKENPQ